MRGQSLHSVSRPGARPVSGARKLIVRTTLVGALLLALMASRAAAAPIVEESHNSSTTTYSDNRCGIDVTITDSFMFNEQDFVNTRKLEINETQLITSAATGKSVEQIAAETQTNNTAPIDNGDGTTSLIFTFTGLEMMLKLPNGPVLGRDVGPITFTLTFDANGNFSIVSSDEKGPHPFANNDTLYCDLLVPALT